MSELYIHRHTSQLLKNKLYANAIRLGVLPLVLSCTHARGARTHPKRDGRADELDLAAAPAPLAPLAPLYTKTSLMLGLGETKEEVLRCMADIRAAGVDVLTLGFIEAAEGEAMTAR